MRLRTRATLPLLAVVSVLFACGSAEEPARPVPAPPEPEATPPSAAATPADLDRGLLLGLAPFEVTPEGKVNPVPQPARLDILTRRGGRWEHRSIEDPDSNVFHKAMVYEPPQGGPGILTLGGTGAYLKLWRVGAEPETLWTKDFGGKFSRMRDAEIADLFGDGTPSIAVATHDQGVVATVRPSAGGGYEVTEIDAEPDTFVHEIEIGDLDGDGTLEVYATPSEPNRLDGTPQPGKVVRYVPARGEGRVVVADLGSRHAKEILVDDLDGDGRDELYVAVEAETEGQGASLRILHPVEIRRYDADTDPSGGRVVASLDDRLCRFLTLGDVDGDGRREMVAAAFRSGLWLLRPGAEPGAEFEVTLIDRNSSGFEHAAILTDLDGDGVDELYVASDDQGEVRRYVWNGSGFDREIIFARAVPRSVFTWNIMPVPLELIP
ncbi:MAG: VCBS repeat-containing protein [Deltaproteobacteria bacterium]|nr:MAG: VCBS repeat-containing protein [Deltaproteobacteria bacterium]